VIDEAVEPELERRLRAALDEMIPKLAATTVATAGPLPTASEPPAGPEPVVDRRRGRRVRWAAAGLVAAALVGLIVMTTRDGSHVTPGSGSTTPDHTASSAPAPSEAPARATPPTFGPLLSTPVSARVAPLALIDEPGWETKYVYGTSDLPLGDLNPHQLILVGDGPRFDSPWLNAWSDTQAVLATQGQPVTIGTAQGLIVDVDNRISLEWTLATGRIAHVQATGLDQQHTVELASTIDFTPTTPAVDVPAGYTRIDSAVPEQWLQFEFQYANTVHAGRTIQLNGSNLGAISLVGYGALAGTTRTIAGTAVSYQPDGDSKQIAWLAGGWAYSVTAAGFNSDDELFATIASLHLTDGTAFVAAAPSLQLQLPGDRVADIQRLEQNLELPSNTPTGEWSPSQVVTNERDFAFTFYFGLACGWKRTWLTADGNADQAGKDAAAAGVDTIAAKTSQATDLSAEMYSELATAMRANDHTQVTGFGSNDCPTWSDNIG
jgi:hypothetical protein